MDRVLDLGGESIRLLPERAALVESSATLLVADLHVDKTAAYRRQGIPIPEGILEESLARLGQAIDRTGTREVVILGDLLHAARGPDEESRARMTAWRRERDLPMRLVGGNHDRAAARILDEWAIEGEGPMLALGASLELRHDPAHARGDRPTIAGHLHPMAALGGGSRRLLLPCFHLAGRILVLPALTAFASGVRVEPEPGDRVFVVAERRVLEVPVPAPIGG